MSILIKNSKVYDGSTQPPKEKDILIKGEFIKKIEESINRKVDQKIEAQDSITTPGFIDINSGCDHHMNLFQNPSQNKYLKEGITTTIGGTDGLSLAPYRQNSKISNNLKITAGSTFSKVNINWKDFGEYLHSISKLKIGTNFGSLVGYLNVKSFLEKNIKINKEGSDVILNQIRKSLKNGALGVSFNLKRPYPKKISLTEMKEIAKIVSENNKILAITPNLQKPNETIKNVKEIAKKWNPTIQINNFQPLKGKAKKFKKLLKNMDKKIGQYDINFDLNPYKKIKLTPYNILLDELIDVSISKTLENLKENKQRVIEDLKSVTRKKVKILHVPDELEHIRGKNIKEIAEGRGKNQAEMLFKIINISKLQLVLLVEGINKKAFQKSLKSKFSFLSTQGIHLESNESNKFLKLLKKAKNRKVKLSKEEIIQKITRKPAEKYNLEKRGQIKKGYYADINIIKNNTIQKNIVNGKIKKGNGKILK